MPTRFSAEIGDRILSLIHAKNWKVCYEFRNWGSPDEFQSMEEIFEQVALTLEIGPRYHVFPGPLDFDEFSRRAVLETLQVPKVTIAGELRIVFGFGLREDHCFFVTHTKMHPPTADRKPKVYEYMLDALESLEVYG